MANRKQKTEDRKPGARKSSRNLSWFLLRFLGVGLGGVFFYAGLQKHYHDWDFAEAVLAYQLGPLWLAGLVAAVLPWVELIAGGLLIVGLKRRSCLLVIALLAAAFLVVLAVTMARGLKIDCGCGLFFQRQVGLVAIAEDLALLAGALGLYWWEWKTVSSEQ
ncbi:MAG: DoxX family protein [Desulfobaccales bacterium]